MEIKPEINVMHIYNFSGDIAARLTNVPENDSLKRKFQMLTVVKRKGITQNKKDDEEEWNEILPFSFTKISLCRMNDGFLVIENCVE